MGWGGIVDVVAPAFQRGLKKAGDHIGFLGDHLFGRDDGRAVRRITAIGQQKEFYFLVLLLRLVWLGRRIALLRDVLVGEKWLQVEGVWPYLIIGKTIFGAQPRPEGNSRRAGHPDRLALHPTD